MIKLFLISQIIWGPEKCISPDTISPLEPKACVWKDTIHLVFYSGNYEIIYLRSVDKGETWEEPKNLTINDPVDAGLPDITVWGKKVHVVYYNKPAGDSLMYIRSIDGGNTWEAPRTLLKPGGFGHLDCRNDTVYLAAGAGGTTNPHGVVMRSCDGGTTWQLLYSDSLLAQRDIKISLSYLHIPTQRLGIPPYTEVYYFYSPDLGNTWIGPIRISPIDNWDSHSPYISVRDTNVYIFWKEGMYCGWGQWWNINLRKSHNNGNSFSERIILSNLCYSREGASYAKDSIVVVVYTDERDNPSQYPWEFELYWRASYDYGNTWTDEQRLTYHPGEAVWPELCGWGNDIYLFWVEMEDSQKLYFKKGTYVNVKEKDKEIKDDLKIICSSILFLPSDIKFFVKKGIKYSLSLIDLNGRKIKVLKEGIGKGLENIYLENVKEGSYFIVLEGNGKNLKRKITILKRGNK
jgi:hypothetical protein